MTTLWKIKLIIVGSFVVWLCAAFALDLFLFLCGLAGAVHGALIALAFRE